MSKIKFKLGLRGKSILIAFISSFILFSFFLFYAIPAMEKQAVSLLKKTSQQHLQTLSIGVVGPLLKRQYAALYELLDSQQAENSGWKNLTLVTEEGLMVYPLIAEKSELSQGEVFIETDVVFLDEKLGKLSLISNISNELEELRLQLYRNILAVLFTLFFLLIIILFFIEKKITSPLAKLNLAFMQLARQNYSYELPEYTNDEVGEVIAGFKTMRDKMHSHKTEMNGLYESEKLMTEKLRLLVKDVEAERHNAEKANEAKSQFLSSMSHELRTPMNAILGFGQLLDMNDEENLTLEQREGIKEILNAGNHLLNLINEVLDLSKIESGELKISMESVNFSTVLNECFALINPLAEQGQISIFNSISPKLDYYLRADNVRLKQVLLNLLSNAIKYNRQQGNVTLTAKKTNDKRLRILITDTGQGLSSDQQQKLFQPFERLDSEFSTVEGTGIGLVISKRLVELMGGVIGVISTPGLGSTFWIELDLIEEITVLPDETTLIETPSLNTLPDQNALILYVEDNPANLKVIEQLIKKRTNINLISAPSPLLALDIAQAHRPDLILLDINLPEMDGYELLSRLRTYEHLKNIPAVAISANATRKDVKKGLDAGFIDYLTKPIDVKQFYKMIDLLIGKGDSQ
ncbi:MAG: response regulator [Methylomarinum sp.]|nr:response regulator [Methylomarinum sp.]